ncbi:MAG: hypothetical protein IPL62_12805 [Caulobacteraceae bacterium]|nr:hypothetical protein [Caulobacteraceae bacterium]
MLKRYAAHGPWRRCEGGIYQRAILARREEGALDDVGVRDRAADHCAESLRA